MEKKGFCRWSVFLPIFDKSKHVTGKRIKVFVVFVWVIFVRWTQDLTVRLYLRFAVMKWHSRLMNMKAFIKIGMKLLGARDCVTATLTELIWHKLQGSHMRTQTHTYTSTIHIITKWRTEGTGGGLRETKSVLSSFFSPVKNSLFCLFGYFKYLISLVHLIIIGTIKQYYFSTSIFFQYIYIFFLNKTFYLTVYL